MKKIINILIISTCIIACFFSWKNQKYIIKTSTKEYKSGTISAVSTRDLAMLASLVYEDVPNDYIYSDSKRKDGCLSSTGNLKSNCFYKAYDDEFVTLQKTSDEEKYKVFQYVEGMSNRKVNSIVSKVTSSFQEDGEKYYFLNFAKTRELEEEGWSIFDYGNVQTESGSKIESLLGTDNINIKGVFDAVTFKKGDNYVIAYRGTDYPDLLEWIQDVGYAFDGEHAEAAMAYSYAQEVYDAILKKSPNAKIYVTGHSLGAYLAQVGGAAIINKEAGIDVTQTTAKAYQTYDDYKVDYYKSNSHLEQVAYFNGMGVGGVFVSNDFIRQIQNALVYLSTYTKYGEKSSTGRYLNYSNQIQSSGRLVSYEMDGDPISAIGLHYGEIYKLETGADAITNHRGRHENAVGDSLPEIFEALNSVLSDLDKVQQSVTTSELIQLLKMSLSTVLDQSSETAESGNIPNSIVNQLKNEYNIDINRFNLGSLVDNLNSDLDSFSSRYGINNLFDHFNINHETDSFACIKDNKNGYIESIALEVNSDNLNCKDNVCYTNKDYDDKGFVFNEQVITQNYTGNNVTLTAKVDGACAKQYIWYTSPDGINWTTLGVTIDNKIIIPQNLFGNNNEDGEKSNYFKVGVTYGDKFTELKSTFNSGSSIIKYNKSTTYEKNPTINDNVVSASRATIESASIKVSLVTDRTAPKCSVPSSTHNAKLSCKFFGSACTKKVDYLNITCSDEENGIIGSGFNLTSINISTETKDTGLLPSIELLKSRNKTSYSENSLTRKIAVQLNRIPSYKVPKVIIKGKIYDQAGNYTTINRTINYKITKTRS